MVLCICFILSIQLFLGWRAVRSYSFELFEKNMHTSCLNHTMRSHLCHLAIRSQTSEKETKPYFFSYERATIKIMRQQPVAKWGRKTSILGQYGPEYGPEYGPRGGWLNSWITDGLCFCILRNKITLWIVGVQVIFICFVFL